MIADTLLPPYYAVIFTSIRTATGDGYAEMAKKMDALAASQPGYLGMESAKNELGITVSYWKSTQDISSWKRNSEHLVAQHMGIKQWYSAYKVRIALVERDYGFNKL